MCPFTRVNEYLRTSLPQACNATIHRMPALHRTIFTTPVLSPALRGLSRAVLRLLGWRIEGALPDNATRSVLIAAPHPGVGLEALRSCRLGHGWDLSRTRASAIARRSALFFGPLSGLLDAC